MLRCAVATASKGIRLLVRVPTTGNNFVASESVSLPKAEIFVPHNHHQHKASGQFTTGTSMETHGGRQAGRHVGYTAFVTDATEEWVPPHSSCLLGVGTDWKLFRG